MTALNYENLRKFVAPEFVFGDGARGLTAHYVKNLEIHRPLLVTDEGLLASGWPQQVIADLEEEDIGPVVFSNVTPNPKDTEVMGGAAFFAQAECDAIVAVGGGSVIDCAKGIGIVTSDSVSGAEEDSPTMLETDMISPDGAVIPVEATFGLHRLQGTRFAMVVARDITKRKKVREELRGLATAIEYAAEAVIITDPDGIVQYVNPAFERISGDSRAETVGHPPRFLRGDSGGEMEGPRAVLHRVQFRRPGVGPNHRRPGSGDSQTLHPQ